MTTLQWRRLDGAGLERLAIAPAAGGWSAQGGLVTLVDGGAALACHWLLDAAWSVQVAVLRRLDAPHELRLERCGEGWHVDGVARPDLDGAVEPDLSLPPFCNSFPIRRLGREPGALLTLDTACVDGHALTVVRSRQRYERLDARHVRYLDLGTASGFTAVIRHDEAGLVEHYEALFEREAASD